MEEKNNLSKNALLEKVLDNLKDEKYLEILQDVNDYKNNVMQETKEIDNKIRKAIEKVYEKYETK